MEHSILDGFWFRARLVCFNDELRELGSGYWSKISIDHGQSHEFKNVLQLGTCWRIKLIAIALLKRHDPTLRGRFALPSYSQGLARNVLCAYSLEHERQMNGLQCVLFQRTLISTLISFIAT
jgi:hypothetical protein